MRDGHSADSVTASEQIPRGRPHRRPARAQQRAGLGRSALRPAHPARSRHACVRSLERCARPGPEAVNSWELPGGAWGCPKGMISYRHDDGAWLNAAGDHAPVVGDAGPFAGLDVEMMLCMALEDSWI